MTDEQVDRMAHAAAHTDGACSHCARGVASRLDIIFPGTDIVARTEAWLERVTDQHDCEFGG